MYVCELSCRVEFNALKPLTRALSGRADSAVFQSLLCFINVIVDLRSVRLNRTPHKQALCDLAG